MRCLHTLPVSFADGEGESAAYPLIFYRNAKTAPSQRELSSEARLKEVLQHLTVILGRLAVFVVILEVVILARQDGVDHNADDGGDGQTGEV